MGRVCFRSRSGLHCISEGGQSDAGGSSVGGALLLHAAAAGTGQSGDQHASFLLTTLPFQAAETIPSHFIQLL